MGWLSTNHQKSMFGQLLVRKKLISQEQLDRAIEQQRKTGQRLGDIFAEWNIITHEHVRDVLRTQRNLRLAAAIATSLLAPMETYAAEALPTLVASTPVVLTKQQSGMQMLTEDELSDTAAQGFDNNLMALVKQQVQSNGVEVLGDMAKIINPLLGFLDSNVSMKDVVYDPSQAAAVINKDGSMTLSLPSSIGQLNFADIRVKGSDGPSFGSISINNIDLTGTTITVGIHH